MPKRVLRLPPESAAALRYLAAQLRRTFEDAACDGCELYQHEAPMILDLGLRLETDEEHEAQITQC